MPVLIEVKNLYDHALRYACQLDDAVMEHHGHEEAGNWGVHWRLDEVLRLVFPTEHTDDVWPKNPWYPHSMAEDQRVVVASDDDENVDERRSALIAQVNDCPKTRCELELLGLDVWDTEQLGNEFAILGFRAPFVVVERYKDGVRGSLLFQHEPRFYFEFRSERVL